MILSHPFANILRAQSQMDFYDPTIDAIPNNRHQSGSPETPLESCCSTRDGHTLVESYVRVESENPNISFDIVKLCCHFFGDFSHLIGEAYGTSAYGTAIKSGMWYVDLRRGLGS